MTGQDARERVGAAGLAVGPAAGAGVGLTARLVVERGAFRLDVDLTVAPGEVLAVLGPNGAGKTTTLRAVAGLTRVSAGRVVAGDEVWTDTAAGTELPARARRVGYVFQDHRLFPHLSVLDNVAFAARARGARRADARAHAVTLLDRLGLRELAGRAPGSLSGGQSQQVALARAHAADPVVLLLDEPFASLDAHARQDLRATLRRELHAAGLPTLLVVHDALDAMVVADRVLVVEGGRTVQAGMPHEVASRPATQYVARLMGLNLYRGVVADAASGAVRLDAGGELAGTVLDPDTASGARRPAAGDRVLVAVRPTAVTLHVAEPAAGSARNRWTGVVAALEALGDRVRVTVDGPVPAVVDVTPGALAELRLVEGTRVWCTVKATEALVYADA